MGGGVNSEVAVLSPSAGVLASAMVSGCIGGIGEIYDCLPVRAPSGDGADAPVATAPVEHGIPSE